MKTSRDKILNAAIDEFSQYGFDGARVDRIAKRSKFNKAMIYYHFKNKEALYAALLQTLAQTIMNTVQDTIQKAVETGNPLLIFEAYAHHISNLDKRYFLIMMRELSSRGKFIKKIIAPTFIEPMTQVIGNMYKVLKEKHIVKDLHPQYTMISVAGAVIFYNLMRLILQGTAVHEQYFNEEHVNEYIANLLQLLSGGIMKKEDV
ncbi:MAG: TetR/AcrR family transcriptional regulator [Spirochaetota bacterium]